MDEFKFKRVDLQSTKNQLNHKTNGLSSSTLVLRRGQAFQILVSFDGQTFDPSINKLVFLVVLDPLSVELPVSGTSQPSTAQWSAILEQGVHNTPHTIAVSLFSPASSAVGVYALSLRIHNHTGVKTHSLGQFTLLCNPWCQGDSVFLSSEELRDEYVRSDIGLLFKGTPKSLVQRPWSFDQYEKGILDICMKLLQLSPQHLTDKRKDLLNRTYPVYISRVISAMINCDDGDRGVLRGKWSGEYNDGINPSEWSGSADILWKWSESQFSPVKYGQCWVFAAVMCTVMRALGIPTRVVTNFNSAHDTDGNMVIQEYYSERGEKLSSCQDSIWNFHVWVESWMKRPDLGQEFDGWQALDPTPQERSTGMYRCGPASMKAIREKIVEAHYDIPFVYAEVNADVRKVIMRNGKVLSSKTDTKSVGTLICTKHPGSMQMLDLTSQYKTETDERPTPYRSCYSHVQRAYSSAERTTLSGFCYPANSTVPKSIAVSLLLKTTVIGENIIFNVRITNNDRTQKDLKVHVNAQHKEYNSNPTETFWEAQNYVKIARNQNQIFEYKIFFSNYALMEVREDFLVNLAVVIEDVVTGERTLASQEFNIISPTLTIQIANENFVIVNKKQVAVVTFTNPFTVPVYGELTVTSSGILRDQISLTVQAGETKRMSFQFTPKMTGDKMLHASLVLTNLPTVLHGYKIVNVKQA